MGRRAKAVGRQRGQGKPQPSRRAALQASVAPSRPFSDVTESVAHDHRLSKTPPRPYSDVGRWNARVTYTAIWARVQTTAGR